MPLLKRKPVPMTPLPDLSVLAEDQEVFFLKATGEIFLDYDSYANRLSYLLCRIFQCEASGKGSLDYFAALESEKAESRVVRERFPDELKGRVLLSVQYMVVGRLDGLVDLVFERFKDRYFGGEKVFVDLGGDKYFARISRVFPPASIRALLPQQPGSSSSVEDYSSLVHKLGIDLNITYEEANKNDDPNEYLYTVQLMDEEHKFEGSFMEVKGEKLSRDRLAFSKSILKRYIKECVQRDPLIASPWIVKPAIANAFGIPQKVSEENEERNRLIREEKLGKRRKNVPEEGAPGAPPKKRKVAGTPGLTPGPGGIKSDDPSRLSSPHPRPPTVPAKPIKYPIEDLDLDPMSIHDGRILRRVNTELPPLPPKPVPSRELPVPKDLFDGFLATWNFLNVFSKPLALTTFSLDDLAGALYHNTLQPRSRLLSEIHACLTNIIATDTSRVLGSTGPKPIEEGVEQDEFDKLLRRGLAYSKRWDRTAKLKYADGRDGWERHMIGALCQRGGPVAMEKSLERILKHLFSAAGARTEEEKTVVENGNGVKEEDGKTASAKGSSPELRNDDVKEEANEEKIEVDEEEKDEIKEDEEEIDELELDGDLPEGVDVAMSEDLEAEAEGIEGDPAEQYLSLPLEDKLEILNYLVTLASGSKVVRAYIDDSETQLTEFRKQRAEVNKERKALIEQKAIMEGKPVAAAKTEVGTTGEGTPGPTSVPLQPSLSATGSSNGHVAAPPPPPSAPTSEADHAPEPAAPAAEEEDELDEEDQLADDSDDAASTVPSESGGATGILSARRMALEEKRLERIALEASRKEELNRAREEARIKSIGRKEENKAKNELEEAMAKNAKKDDFVEREFRRFQGVTRVRPLGKDRFFNRYWWFDGIGGMNLIGVGNGILYGTGRLFIQGPTQEDWNLICGKEGEKEMLERRKREEVDESAILGVNEWAYYEEDDEIEALQGWLNGKGTRELALKNALAKWRSYILAGSRRRQQDMSKPYKPIDARRSSRRNGDEPKHRGYLSYTNKLAKI